ncbi:hypothetical protein FB45DRAFT_1053763 [Roridomyces roridus]|uniref:Uncharacterized protein n=1 Tax=Roridomyces roridus TaxID=1738132 RepID=A0AAD7C7B0_9AGAR|nr:hypothetical protein FB45DRAFT_1053763 [Roridomyces roridus]
MPLLESLFLNVKDRRYSHPATTADDFPRLRTVGLDAADHGNWLPIFQLTALTFEDVDSANYYLPILREAVNLVTLYLIDCETDVPPQSSVKLDRLEMLVLGGSYVEGVASQIFEAFTFPALHTLHISAQLLGKDPKGLLTPFITRSGCKIQELLVTGVCDFFEESFHAAFPSIPNITFDAEYDWYTEEQRELQRGLNCLNIKCRPRSKYRTF